MAHGKSGLDRLGFLITLVRVIGAAGSAQAQLQPPTTPTAEPAIHDAKVRPRNDQTDGKFTQTPYAGTSSSNSDVKRIRTTRERNTDGAAPPAIAPLQPPPPSRSFGPAPSRLLPRHLRIADGIAVEFLVVVHGDGHAQQLTFELERRLVMRHRAATIAADVEA